MVLFSRIVAGSWAAMAAGAWLVVACGDRYPQSVFGSEFDGTNSPLGPEGPVGTLPGTGDGGSRTNDDGGKPGVITAIVRDFRRFDPDASSGVNPDFQNIPPYEERPVDAGRPGNLAEAQDRFFPVRLVEDNSVVPTANTQLNVVADTLGPDGKPQYNSSAMYDGGNRTLTTHGPAAFAQWYNDAPGTNVSRAVPIVLTKNAQGIWSYDSFANGSPIDTNNPASAKGFWPIDDNSAYSTKGDGFGNQPPEADFLPADAGPYDHNYHFTVEIHTTFTYRGNESFAFSGDDDVFVFINKKLVINIGGIHEAFKKEISIPDVASSLGLVVGNEYALDFFQAERNYVQSNLRIDTTLDLKTVPLR